MGTGLRLDMSKNHIFNAFQGLFWAKINRRHIGGLFGTVLDTKNSTGIGFWTFRLTSLLRAKHDLLSIH